MKRWVFVCLLALTPGGFAQTADRHSLMAQAYASERVRRYAEATAGYWSALRIVEQSSPAGAYLPNILNSLASASIGLSEFTAQNHVMTEAYHEFVMPMRVREVIRLLEHGWLEMRSKGSHSRRAR
jgi:hypothetical protein